MSDGFARLLEPGQIGKMQLKNRIVMAPMESSIAAADGSVTQEVLDYYEERARGGVALLIVEATAIDFVRGRLIFHSLSIDSDRCLTGMSRLANAIKKHGAMAAIQIHHTGGSTKKEVTGYQPLAPSPLQRDGFDLPTELTISEIEDIVIKYAKAARRAKEAGFDAIEVNACHHYLIAQFLSPYWNRRTDEYGGSLKNRARFALDVVRAARQEVGDDYPFWLRINAEEADRTDGTSLAEAKALAQMLLPSGVSAINVSAQLASKTGGHISFRPPGWGIRYAAAIKEVFKGLPVMAVGALDPYLAEKALEEGHADFICIGKALRADPDWPKKLIEGNINDINPCIQCYACYAKFRPNGVRLCTVNPAVHREREYRILPAANKKKVLVVGGGPSGMEVARVAALRGHVVTLCEKREQLGGKLLSAAVPPYKWELERLNKYLARQVSRLPITAMLHCEVTQAFIESMKPDVVVIATGGRTFIPPVTGIDKPGVLLAEDVLLGKAKAGNEVVVLGGGQVGCEVAEYLGQKGHAITVVEMLDKLAMDMPEKQGRAFLTGILEKLNVTVKTGAKGVAVNEEGLIVESRDGWRELVHADSVILACGYRPNLELCQSAKELTSEFYSIGDCVKPRGILEALDDAARVGRAI